MQLHRSPRVWLLSLPLVVACNQGGEALAGPIDLGGSSSSSTTSDPTTTSTPTSAAPTTSATSTTPSTSTGPDDAATTTDDEDTRGSSGAAASSTGDAPSPSCGDGQLDPGEECDPGISQLSQTGACTLSCETAKCGDNLVWEGEEFCDNGTGNNDDLYGGCTTQCQFGPMCNDGKIQGPEECDMGTDNGTGEFPTSGVPCDNGCRFQARLVFLSSTAYKGGEIGGVEGAHIKCQNLAKQAKYDNAAKFMAWISDAQHSPFQDFTKTAGLPYVRPDGVRVADDWDDLVLNGPIEGIIVTETGKVIFDKWVWTGTAPSGKVLDPAAHCQSWTSSAPAEKSRVGSSGVDKVKFPQAWVQWVDERQWTNLVSRPCFEALPLYCVEQ